MQPARPRLYLAGADCPATVDECRRRHACAIIYSPTIYANDANGVEQKLIEDKERLDRWWSEKQMHDDVEVYA